MDQIQILGFRMNRKVQRLKYLSSDFLAASVSWFLLFILRKGLIESPKFGFQVSVNFDLKFWVSVLGISVFWIILHYLSGYYKQPYRKSRLHELGVTFRVSLIGTLILFFTLILDDTIISYKSYYLSFSILLGLHFILTYIPRFIITSRTNHLIFSGKIGFNTIIIGGNGKATEVYQKLTSGKKSSGNKILGFICVNPLPEKKLESFIPLLGHLEDVSLIIEQNQVEEAILATESNDSKLMGDIINKLKERKIIIKIIPGLYEILSGQVKMSSVYGTPLIEISDELIPAWQEAVKQSMDLVVALLALILTLPLNILLALAIKFGSRGPAIYTQERIGKYGRPFNLYKFRTMYHESEEFGPSLSSSNDPRITSIGRFMRKFRIDEIPNFVNVLLGDMSLVGPRPERKYFIDQILKKAPYYIHLQKIKPGITSWGQVKYGYAENVDQMIERLSYDLIYIEDMSLYADLKILTYTILTILGARGK